MNVRELFDLRGRVAIVTGGGKGIGRQMATALAELGADLVLCARKAERCEAAAEELSAGVGVRAIGMRCDVRDPERGAGDGRSRARRSSAASTCSSTTRAPSGARPPEDMPLEGWQKVVNVNLTGVFLCSQAAGRVMLEEGAGGSIVNIASVAGLARRADPST